MERMEADMALWKEETTSMLNQILYMVGGQHEEQPQHWQGMHEHLFTSRHLAPLVKANLEEVTGQLKALELRLEKTRFAYEQG